jgi:hypothetical protein
MAAPPAHTHVCTHTNRMEISATSRLSSTPEYHLHCNLVYLQYSSKSHASSAKKVCSGLKQICNYIFETFFTLMFVMLLCVYMHTGQADKFS